MTRSRTPSAEVAVEDCPMPSRITLPPPNFASSPGVVRSFSISMNNSVSARRTRSPVVGPYRSAYCRRGIFRLMEEIPQNLSEILISGVFQRARLGRFIRKPVRKAIETVNVFGAAYFNQGNFLRVAGLKAHRGSC